VVWCFAWCGMVRCCAVQISVEYGMVLHDIVQYDKVIYGMDVV